MSERSQQRLEAETRDHGVGDGGEADSLAAATACLRQVEPAPERLVHVTRGRVMAGLHARRRRRTSRLSVLLPLAAIVVGSTAWAAATGRLGHAWDSAFELVRVDTPRLTAPSVDPGSHGRSGHGYALPSEPDDEQAATADDEQTPAPAEDISPSEPSDPTEAHGPGRPTATAPRAAASPTAAAGTVQDAPDADGAELTSYRLAHQLHFGGGSPAEAMRGWDDYLASHPKGRFALEARYNRAICLVRMGRSGDAIRALRPFAEGQYGRYRQSEAEQLIDSLERDAG